MDQSLVNRLIFSGIVVLAILVLMYVKKFSKFSTEWKIATLFTLLFFLQISVRMVLLLNYYDLVVGTTKGISHAKKQTTTYIDYEYNYNNKEYNSSKHFKGGVKTKNGKYYVRVAKFIPFLSEIDFSMPVKEKTEAQK